MCFCYNDMSMSMNFYYKSFNFLNNIYMLWAHLTYVTLFSSSIYVLVTYLFYVTQKICICYCSPWHMLLKKSTNVHTLFLEIDKIDNTSLFISIYLCFFCTLQQRSGTQRDCLLKQDMSAGDNDNDCSGRLSIGTYKATRPVYFLGSQHLPSCVIQETHQWW